MCLQHAGGHVAVHACMGSTNAHGHVAVHACVGSTNAHGYVAVHACVGSTYAHGHVAVHACVGSTNAHGHMAVHACAGLTDAHGHPPRDMRSVATMTIRSSEPSCGRGDKKAFMFVCRRFSRMASWYTSTCGRSMQAQGALSPTPAHPHTRTCTHPHTPHQKLCKHAAYIHRPNFIRHVPARSMLCQALAAIDPGAAVGACRQFAQSNAGKSRHAGAPMPHAGPNAPMPHAGKSRHAGAPRPQPETLPIADLGGSVRADNLHKATRARWGTSALPACDRHAACSPQVVCAAPPPPPPHLQVLPLKVLAQVVLHIAARLDLVAEHQGAGRCEGRPEAKAHGVHRARSSNNER